MKTTKELRQLLVSSATGVVHIVLSLINSAGEPLYDPNFRTHARSFDRLPAKKTETQGGAGYTGLSIVAEIIDNSIQYTKDNHTLTATDAELVQQFPCITERRIDVTISSNELKIVNNGKGMSEEDVRTWARLAVPSYTEPTPPRSGAGAKPGATFGSNLKSFQFSSDHFTSIMSRFGVGSNLSLSTIGNGEIEARTRIRNHQMAIAVKYSSGEWTGGSESVSVGPSDAPQFVEVRTHQLKASYFPGPVGTAEEYITMLKKHLSHIYFYYLCGPEMFETAVVALARPPKPGEKRPSATQLFKGKFSRPQIVLQVNGSPVAWKESVEYRYLEKAVSAFPLHFQFTTPLEEDDALEHPEWPKNILHDVYGAVFYYAADRGEETHPDVVAAKQCSVSLEDGDFLMSPQQFEIFWNGKLFDGANLKAPRFMDWHRVVNEPRLTKFTTLPPEVFQTRVKCMLFFGRRFLPSKHKWQLSSSSIAYQAFQKLTESFELMQAYCEWLQMCRTVFDSEISWGRIVCEEEKETGVVVFYKSVIVDGVEFTIGSHVSFDSKQGELKGVVKSIQHENPTRSIGAGRQRIGITVDWSVTTTDILVDLKEANLHKVDARTYDQWVAQRKAESPVKIGLADGSNFKPEMHAGSDQQLLVQLCGQKKAVDARWYSRVGALRLRVVPASSDFSESGAQPVVTISQSATVNNDITNGKCKFHFAVARPGLYKLRVDAPATGAKLAPFDQSFVVRSGNPAVAVWESEPSEADVELGTPLPREFLAFRLQDSKGGAVNISEFQHREVILQNRLDPISGSSCRGFSLLIFSGLTVSFLLQFPKLIPVHLMKVVPLGTSRASPLKAH